MEIIPALIHGCAKPLWKPLIAAVCVCGPTCSWPEFIYYIMKDVFPARSHFFWFSTSEKAVICFGGAPGFRGSLSGAVPSRRHKTYSRKHAVETDAPTDWNTASPPIQARKSKLSQGIQPIKETGNAAHMSRAFWVVPAGVLLIMIWHSCRLLTRSIPDVGGASPTTTHSSGAPVTLVFSMPSVRKGRSRGPHKT